MAHVTMSHGLLVRLGLQAEPRGPRRYFQHISRTYQVGHLISVCFDSCFFFTSPKEDPHPRPNRTEDGVQKHSFLYRVANPGSE